MNYREIAVAVVPRYATAPGAVRGTPPRQETRAAYVARLRRTAMSVPPQQLRKIIGSMVRRCRAVVAANGGHIEG